MPAHRRHILQAVAGHRELRHDTVDGIRAAHRYAMATLAAPVTTFTGAYGRALRQADAAANASVAARDDATAAHDDAGDDDSDTAPRRGVVPLAWLNGAGQLGSLRGHVRHSIRDFAGVALALTLTAKQAAAQQAAQEAATAIKRAVDRAPGAAVALTPGDVAPASPADVAQEVAQANDGSDVATLFDGIDVEADDAVHQAVLQAMAAGHTEAWLQRALAVALGISLSRALTVARNETLTAARDVQMLVYRANPHLLRGWTWHANLAHCCMACALMHGTFHELDESLDEHVCGQCQAVPVAWDDPSENGGIEDGADWLSRQDDSVLRDKMGPAAFRAYDAGDIQLDDFLAFDKSEKWGVNIYQASLRQMGRDASDYIE